MNNEQFRRLLVDTPSSSGAAAAQGKRAVENGGATPSSLGSRLRSSIPMTPRNVAGSGAGGVDFARQMREQKQGGAMMGPPPAKRFRSSAAPKGSKLAEGYTDRTQQRRTSAEEDEKAGRVKALEELVRLGQMEYAQFEALRDEIVGADVRAAHLVKGLDYKLLERVRRGEDVWKKNEEKEEEERIPQPPGLTELEKDEAELDEEFESLESKEVVPLAKEERVKKGEMVKKRTRDDILRELKESRQRAAAEQAKAAALGPKFRKVGATATATGTGRPGTSRIERDEKGREVLITVDENGNVKRKVRKAKPAAAAEQSNGLLMPDRDAKPLGMDVPLPPSGKKGEEEEDEDGDIFEGVGADYNPLAGEEEDDDDSGSDSHSAPSSPPPPPLPQAAATRRLRRSRSLSSSPSRSDYSSSAEAETGHKSEAEAEAEADRQPEGEEEEAIPAPKRNYFNTGPDTASSSTAKEQLKTNPLTDPSILSALKKASLIASSSSSLTTHNPSPDLEAARKARHAAMLAGIDRDAADLDLDFGSSRFGDVEDLEEGDEEYQKRLARGEEGDGDGEKKGKRKRGGKKRKGDKNSASDVLGVLERRREAGPTK